MSSDPLVASQKRFFILIGVGYYARGNALRTYNNESCKLRSLKGAVQDVENVHRHIQEDPQLQGSAVFKLTSTRSREGGRETVESKHQLPTRDNILSLFDKVGKLVKEAGCGIVHVHFSCHGVQVTTEYPNLKKSGGIDEAIAPFDACTTGETIRDVELNILIWKLTKNGAHVSVVFDCCHAGSVSRGDSDESDSDESELDEVSGWEADRNSGGQIGKEDGNQTDDLARDEVRKDVSLAPGDGELVQALEDAWASNKRPWMLPINYDLFGSCCEDEKSYETVERDREGNTIYCGVYTRMLLKALEEARTNPDAPAQGHIHDRILAAFKNEERENQTPIFVGNRKRRWLRTTEGDDIQSLSVISVKHNGLILSEGQIQGVTRGSLYAVVPWIQADLSGVSTSPLVKIIDVSPTRSRAKWADGPSSVQPGFKAVLVKHKLEKMRIQLNRAPGPEPRAVTRQYELFDALVQEEADDSSEMMEIVEDGAFYNIRVGRDEKFQLVSSDGTPIAHFPASSNPDVFYEYLSRLVKFETLRNLFNPFPSERMRDCLDISINGKDVKSFCVWDGSPVESKACLDLGVGDASLVVRNRNNSSICIAMFVFSPFWAIDRCYLGQNNEDYEIIGPNQERKTIVEVVPLPDKWDPSIDHVDYIKLFIFDKSLSLTSLRSVEMDPLDDMALESGRGEGNLDDILEAFGIADRGHSRKQDTISGPQGTWAARAADIAKRSKGHQ
ncbi:hypothetical protein PT974_03678 [Cladobotryum mycophilum]|uniref:Peptidase C14 caspase domain-containing protein n=1 Tax=Cladobotryum mycophilum TaxID=491253 RepID=A0ABR0SSZ8_9HYPO